MIVSNNSIYVCVRMDSAATNHRLYISAQIFSSNTDDTSVAGFAASDMQTLTISTTKQVRT